MEKVGFKKRTKKLQQQHKKNTKISTFSSRLLETVHTLPLGVKKSSFFSGEGKVVTEKQFSERQNMCFKAVPLS